MKRRTAIVGGAAVSASILIALTCAELALRSIAPIFTAGNQHAYRYDPVLGVRLRESLRLHRTTDYLDEIVSNRHGTANANDFTGYTSLIFALGDSYTQGTGLAPDQSYPAQLEMMLNLDAGGAERRYAIVNLGLAAYGGEQSLLALERFAATLGNPLACLYLGSDNDFDDDLLFKAGTRHRHVVYGSPHYGSLVPILIWAGNLQLVLRVKLIIASRRLAGLRRKSAMNSGAPIAIKADDRRSASSVERPITVAEREWPAIQKIIEACHARGAQTVIAWSGLPDQSGSYEWLVSKAISDSVLVNDWYPRVQSIRAANPSLPIMNRHSGGHYQAWVAREIAAGFRDHLLSLKAASVDTLPR